MGNGHRAARANLSQERRDDAAAASEHVAKANRDKIAVMLRRRVLHELFGDSLRRAHHAGGANRLVGGDEHEMLDIRLDRGVDDVPRAGDVVRHRLENVVFHQRNVLVSGRVEDCVRPMLLKDVEDSVAIADVGDHGHDVHIREAQRELLEDVEDRILAVSEQNESRRREARELAAELGADRPAGTGDENRLARRELGHRGEIGLDGVATKQVLNLDFAQAGCVALSRNDLGKTWHRSRRNSAAERGAHHLPNHRSRRRRHGDDYLGDAEALDNLRDVRQRTEDGQTGQHVSVLRCVAVDKADRLESELRGGEQLLDDELAGVAGARDQNSLSAFVSSSAKRALACDTHHQARGRRSGRRRAAYQ